MSAGGGELQELSQQLQALESQIDAIQNQIQTLQARKSDLREAVQAVEELESGSTVQVPVGGGAYVRATVEDIDEVIVGIGGGYATEREQENAVELLEERQDQVDDRIQELNSDLAELETEEQELNQRAQQLQQQQMQQQMGQQMSGLSGLEGGDGDDE